MDGSPNLILKYKTYLLTIYFKILFIVYFKVYNDMDPYYWVFKFLWKAYAKLDPRDFLPFLVF